MMHHHLITPSNRASKAERMCRYGRTDLTISSGADGPGEGAQYRPALYPFLSVPTYLAIHGCSRREIALGAFDRRECDVEVTQAVNSVKGAYARLAWDVLGLPGPPTA